MTDSRLAHIDISVSNPYDLFKEWRDEGMKNSNVAWTFNIFNLATASKSGLVSNRNIVLKEIFPDGFAFLTSKLGKKTQHIKENPNVSATFLFCYAIDKRNIIRQIRLEGVIEEMDNSFAKKYYDQGNIQEKIRAHACHQGNETDWSTLQNEVEAKFREISISEKDISVPNTLVAYKIKPKSFDFYYSWNDKIADRVFFAEKNDEWSFVHLEA